MSPIALVATGRPVRPGRRVVRIGLVATDGSCCLQPGTLSRAICYCPPPARAASTYSDGSPGRSSCPGASIMVATTAKKLHLSRAGTANFDGKTCERAALAVNWPTCLAPDIQSQFDLTNSRPGCIFMHRQVRGEYPYLPHIASSAEVSSVGLPRVVHAGLLWGVAAGQPLRSWAVRQRDACVHRVVRSPSACLGCGPRARCRAAMRMRRNDRGTHTGYDPQFLPERSMDIDIRRAGANAACADRVLGLGRLQVGGSDRGHVLRDGV
jgi:hypothetical protein